MAVLDSTAIIDIYKKDKNLFNVLKHVEGDLSTTIMNYQETIFGLNPKDKKYQEESEYYEKLFNNLEIFNLSKKSVNKASSLFWDLSAKGEVIGEIDCLIAGICLINGIDVIITKNVKHFENIAGLKVISY